MKFSFYLHNPWHLVFVFTQKFLSFLPDKLYVSLMYRAKMGHWINWGNPQSFTEKIQWLKINNRNPEFTKLVDKYLVKEYVRETIGDQYVISTLGVWDNPDNINFDNLPDKFVLKTTHGGGNNGVIICQDKSTFDKSEAIKKLKEALKKDLYIQTREYPYRYVRRRILAEEFIEADNSEDLTDYKIYCFNGQPLYIQVIQNRSTRETIDFYDCKWVHQPFCGLTPSAVNSDSTMPKPVRLEEMLTIAKKLAKGKTFLRVDLYQTKEKVLFGELTFFPASGIGEFRPKDVDLMLGDKLILDRTNSYDNEL